MKKLAWVLATCAIVASSASAFAALTLGQKMAAEALVKQFSAADFAARQKAVDRLVEMGPDVIPVVQKALDETVDNEVKLRCQMVLKALGDKAPAAATADKTSREASKVTFDFRNTPLAEVVDKLAELSGNKPFYVDDRIKEMPVTLAVKDMNYWEAVDKIVGPLNLIYARYWTMRGMGGPSDVRLQLIEAEKDAKITGYAGPADVKVDVLSKLEFLRTAKTPGMMGLPQLGPEGLALGLSSYWEDRLDPLTEEIELTKVQTPKGDSLLPQAPADRVKSSQVMAMKAPPCLFGLFVLPTPPPEARSIAELSGVVRLEFGTGEREVRIDDVANAVGKEFKFDDWTITVKNVSNQNGALTVSIEAKYKGQSVEMPRYWMSETYGWYVEAQAGAKRTRGMSFRGGLGGQPWKRAGQGNPGPALQPGTAPKQGESGVMFQGNFGDGMSVVLVLPKMHETKEYPFTIKDIPLP